MPLSDRAQLALDAINRRPTTGIPSWLLHPMEHGIIERLAGAAPGEYVQDPERVYLAMQQAIGTCMIDQWIPTNPLTMGDHGFEERERGATTGAAAIVCDGIAIDGPEAVVEHLERFVFPALAREIEAFDEEETAKAVIAAERAVQAQIEPILKAPYGYSRFPHLAYGTYGYEHYLTAYALYPEVMERHFSLQADLAALHNGAVARAYRLGQLPPICRSDHDMAGSQGLLVSAKSLDRIWFPHFARAMRPLIEAGIEVIRHCDGNLMEMVPRLLEVGLTGFQGFQYEDGMDYERICRMKTRDGRSLIIVAGVSVTRTLPHGTPDDVRAELRWLAEHGPRTGLFLAGSSSITPGVPWENLQALVEGLAYYRRVGRG